MLGGDPVDSHVLFKSNIKKKYPIKHIEDIIVKK